MTNGTHERDSLPLGQGRPTPDDASVGASGATVAVQRRPLLIRDLGWSDAEVADTYHRLRPFEQDWDAPGMDAYDDL